MPNWCSARAEIVCSDKQGGEKLYQKLLATMTEADRCGRGVFVGSDRYWFDSTAELDDNTVTLSGEIRWGFDDDDIVNMIKYLKETADIKTVEVRYEECGCLLYGSYFYNGKTLTDTFVAAEDFPDYDGEDSYYDELENLLETKPTTNYIGEV